MSTPRPESTPRRPRTAVRRALLRFVAAGSAVLLLVGVATVFVAYQVSRDVALRQAEIRGTSFARYVAAPLVDSRVREGDERALTRFGEVMDNRLEEKSIVHIKVWDRDGRVIWADQPGEQDQVYRLEPEVVRLFGTQGAVAGMSNLDKAENEADVVEGPLLEVYAGSFGADREPVVVESYWAPAAINTDVAIVMKRLAPLPVVALLLFAALLFPLAWSLARRVDKAQADSKKSLQHALSAADLERRRIARDLHDGVMQDVSGAGYALSAVGSGLPADAETPRRLVGEVSSLVRQVGESLRSLVADIYPPNLARDGLHVAVEELADRAAEQGVEVSVDIPMDSRDLPIEVSQLCYRVIREALRNVQRHAHAATAQVQAVVDERVVRITVSDDGRGLPEPKGDRGGAHLGLRLLEDTLVDIGGTLSLEPGATRGVVFSATVPLHVDFV